MTRPLRLALFACVCIAQLWAAASGIARYEHTLSAGTAYRFECAPVDPEDPFRGRYVALAFAAANTSITPPDPDAWNQRVFALLGRDERGFAVVTQLQAEAPEDGDYLWLRATRSGGPDGGTRLALPFDRYFMEESAAKQAEIAYRDATPGRDEARAYALVRVRDGLGVIEALVVDDVALGGNH